MSENQNKSVVKNAINRVVSAESNSAATLSDEKLSKYSELAIKMFHTSVLTPKEKIFPAIGTFAERMKNAVNTYRMLYFVDVLKIDMSYVTLILALIGIYDVLNNPLMGMAYDRTRTRWGKARPYMMFSAIPYYMTVFILYSGALFLGNSAGNDPKKIFFVFVTLFIQETFSTIYSIPRSGITSLQTPNPHDRISVALLSEYIGTRGGDIIYGIFLPLMELSNKGYLPISLEGVFCAIAAIGSTIGMAGNMSMAIGCKERIILQPKPADPGKALFYILKNKYALRNFLANLSVSWWSSGGYSWDVVTQQEIFGGTIPTTIAMLPYNIIEVLSVTYISKLQKLFKNNNRNALLAMRGWDMVASVLMTVLGCKFVDKRLLVVTIYGIFYTMNGFNNAPAKVFESEVGREITDYTEYVTGERPDGTFNILTDLIPKIFAPLNAALTVAIFKWSGYDTTKKKLPWAQGNKQTYQKVFFLYNGIKLFPDIIRAIPYLFYDLVGDKREKMYIALNERRALLAKEHSINEELEAMIETLEQVEK